MNIDELQEHCEKVVNPNDKLVFDINSRTYQEHKLILDIIEELKDYRAKNKMLVKIDCLNLEEMKDKAKEAYQQGRADILNAIKNDLHERLTEEMNKPYQDQSVCEGLYFAIKRCDWYLSDDKEC